MLLPFQSAGGDSLNNITPEEDEQKEGRRQRETKHGKERAQKSSHVQ
jgi:hypothetical protein